MYYSIIFNRLWHGVLAMRKLLLAFDSSVDLFFVPPTSCILLCKYFSNNIILSYLLDMYHQRLMGLNTICVSVFYLS